MGRKNGRPGGVKVGAAKKGVQKIEIPSFVSLTLASRNFGRLGPKHQALDVKFAMRMCYKLCISRRTRVDFSSGGAQFSL